MVAKNFNILMTHSKIHWQCKCNMLLAIERKCTTLVGIKYHGIDGQSKIFHPILYYGTFNQVLKEAIYQIFISQLVYITEVILKFLLLVLQPSHHLNYMLIIGYPSGGQ